MGRVVSAQNRSRVAAFVGETLGLRFLLAFFLATALWVILTNGRNPDRIDVWPQPVPVERQGLPGGLTVVGESLGTVKFRIEAPEQTWQRLALSEFRAYVDLSNATPGLAQVPVKFQVSDPSVIVREVIPPTVPVDIERLEDKTVPVKVTVQGAPPFGYSSEKAVPSQETATVSGPSSLVASVVDVEAAVRIDGAKATAAQNVKLIPKNSQGGDVTDPQISVSPQTLVVTVPITQQVSYKTVAVVAVTKGAPADGYQVVASSLDPSTTTILGSPTVLDQINSVPTEPVDIQGAVGDISRTVGLVVPKGASTYQDTTVQAKLTIAPQSGTLAFAVAPQLNGTGNGLRGQVNSQTVSVLVQGTIPALRDLQAGKITVTVDASGLGPGTYDLNPAVQAPAGFTVTAVNPQKVNVTIAPVPTPTPTPTPVPTSTPVPTATPHPTATAAPSPVPSPSPTAKPAA